MNERWRLEELAQLAGQALNAAPYAGQSSGRVRDLPDVRTIRYYTTIGVLDRPLEMRGRTAYYGQRHLLQLVAIKRLQARGMALVDIQKHLAGADTSRLKRWAALPAGFWETAVAQRSAPPSPDDLLKSAPQPSGAGARARFWAAEPAVAEGAARKRTAVPVAAKPAVVFSLAPGVSLLIEGRSSPPDDRATQAALQPELAALLAALAQAGIIDADDCDRGRHPPPTNRGANHVP